MIKTTTFVESRRYGERITNRIVTILENKEDEDQYAVVRWDCVSDSFPSIDIIRLDSYFDELFRNHRNMQVKYRNEEYDDEDCDEDSNEIESVLVCFGDELNYTLLQGIEKVKNNNSNIDPEIFCRTLNRYFSRLVNHQTVSGGFASINLDNEIPYSDRLMARIASNVDTSKLNKQEINFLLSIQKLAKCSINILNVKIQKDGTIDMIEVIKELLAPDYWEKDFTVACLNNSGDYKKDFGLHGVSKHAPNNMEILREIQKLNIFFKINNNILSRMARYSPSQCFTIAELALALLYKNDNTSFNYLKSKNKETIYTILSHLKFTHENSEQPF